MANTGYNNTTLKQQNRGLMLKLIATEDCISRVELARRTGLSKMAATNIINEFLAEGLVEERESVRTAGKGRNPVHLVISENAPKIIGVHISRTDMSAVLCDLNLNQIRESSYPLNKESIKDAKSLMFRVIDAVKEGIPNDRIFGIGVGSLGPVDNRKGVILNPPDFYNLHDIPIQEDLKARYDLPVFLDGHYNCAAIAEQYFGNGRGCQDFLFVGFGQGIGSGVISRGETYRNRSGFTSDLGHTSINWRGKLCSCGNRGCLENYVTTDIMSDRFAEITGKQKSFHDFCVDFRESAPEEIDRVFREGVEMLATAIANASNMFNPDKVIIGDKGYWMPDRYIEYLEHRVNQKKVSGKYRHITVQKSFFEDRAHIIGSGCGFMEALFRGVLF